MKFGFVLPNNWGIDEPGAVAEIGVEAEALGLDSVWVNHHIVNAGYIAERLGDRPYYDALTTLTWVGAQTERVRLGTSVLVMPYLHPLGTAKALATLDQMSGGRVVAGLGVGGLPEENEILGVPYEGRGRLGDEFIEAMQAVWSPGDGALNGEHYRFEGAVASPKPSQAALPIWIGGSGGPARRRTAKSGDGWHPLCSLDGLARRMPAMVESLEASGRARSDLVVAPRVAVEALPDGDAVQAWADAGADELIVMAGGHDIASHRDALAHVAKLATL